MALLKQTGRSSRHLRCAISNKKNNGSNFFANFTHTPTFTTPPTPYIMMNKDGRHITHLSKSSLVAWNTLVFPCLLARYYFRNGSSVVLDENLLGLGARHAGVVCFNFNVFPNYFCAMKICCICLSLVDTFAQINNFYEKSLTQK